MGDMRSPVNIPAARALAEKATAGPWEAYSLPATRRAPAHCAVDVSGTEVRLVRLEGSFFDAEFIAAARTLVPALLDELEAAQARVRELEAAVQRVRDAVAGDPTTVARAGVVMSFDGPDGVNVDDAVNILADAVIAVDDALRGSDA